MFDGPLTAELDPGERRARLRLARSARIGPVTFHEALAHFGSARAACARLDTTTETAIAREEDALATAGGRFLVFGDPAYPPALAALPDAPPVLSAVGDLGLLGRPTLAIVGAREASMAACRLAGELAGALGAAGFVVASGLARGIDAAAHRGSLATGTIAVLAGGHDAVYPPEHEGLLLDILENGAAISEMPFGWELRAGDFPRRNRLISGLSLGVIVVEAAKRSGSLITARLALEQGREVFAVPGSPLDPRAEGTNALLKEGATLVTEAADVLAGLKPITAPPRELEEAEVIDAAPRAGEPGADQRARIAGLLGPAPVSLDDLVRLSGASPAIVRMVLLELEIAGRLERHGNGLVSLV